MNTNTDVLTPFTILQIFLRVLNIEMYRNIRVLHFFTKLDTCSTTTTRRENISSVSYKSGLYKYLWKLNGQIHPMMPLLLASEIRTISRFLRNTL